MHTIDSSVFFLLSVFDDFLNTIFTTLNNKKKRNERTLNQKLNNICKGEEQTRYAWWLMPDKNAVNESELRCKVIEYYTKTALQKNAELGVTASRRHFAVGKEVGDLIL